MNLAVIVAVFLPMVVEARLAARHERAQRAIGGMEPPGDVYPAMQVAYPLAFAAMITEGFVRGGAPSIVAAAGLALFAAAKLLKWWAIASLGQAWTFRVIVVPGARRIRTGPYRLLAHPNYIAVVGELIGTAIMTGALISGPVATAAFSLLILKRIAIENRALDRLAS
jgi:methyltransferase